MKKNNSIIKILNLLHMILFLMILIPYSTNNKKILYFYYYILIFVYLGWILFRDRCWFSIIEQKVYKKYNLKKNKNQLINYLKDYFGINVTNKEKLINFIFSFINHLTFLLLTCKLNRMHIAVGWIIFYETYKKSSFVK